MPFPPQGSGSTLNAEDVWAYATRRLTNLSDVRAEYIDLLNQMDDNVLYQMSFLSPQDDEIIITIGSQNLNLPNLVIADIPANAQIVRVIGFLKVAAIKDSSGANNAINNANMDLAVDADPAYGSTVTAINIPDNSWLVTFAISQARGGDVIVGDQDVAAEITGNGTFYARLENAQADGSNLILEDVQWGVKVYFTLTIP